MTTILPQEYSLIMNNKIHLFHGSNKIIKQPFYGGGKPYNDYGSGFYCTEVPDLAREWAVSKNRNGFVNEYVIGTNGLSVLNLNSDEYTILNWLSILICNRKFDIQSDFGKEAREYIISNFLPNYESYDIIIGYRADDSYFSFAQDFINGTISVRQLSRALVLGELGQQFVLKSRKAFDRIRFLGAEPACREDWLAKKQVRDRMARRAYFDIEKNKRERGDIYITRILEEEMKADDRRLR